MSKFIVLEGLDGAGKSTQIDLLLEYFKRMNIQYHYLHFPRLETPIIGEMIARFLRGEFGAIDEVDPYLVALMYATDRHHAQDQVRAWLENGAVVLVDRYIHSNIAFQCAKVAENEKKQALKDWILQLEYECNRIPKPDVSLFLHVPFEFIEQKLKNKRMGSDRAYLHGAEDIHEQSLTLQKKVEQEYINLFKEEEGLYIVPCYDDCRQMLTPLDISEKIIQILKKEGIQ